MSTGKIDSEIRIGISSCLLGEKVRYDSGHKRNKYIMDVLRAHVCFVPVCPEVEVGMGVPRETVSLVGTPDSPRMVGNETGEDWTARMLKFSSKRLKQIEKCHLSGYILKAKSPSCGMDKVKIYNDNGQAIRKGQGLWAGPLRKYFPNMPVEEEGRLDDPKLRENFIVRIFAYHNLQKIFDYGAFKRKDVVEFHSRQKLLMMTHSPKHYKILDKLVGEIANYTPSAFKMKYCGLFMEGLKFIATTRKNIVIMRKITGYMKKNLSNDEQNDIQAAIANYGNNQAPYIVPLTLIRHYANRYANDDIRDQSLLNPHRDELMLRNHA